MVRKRSDEADTQLTAILESLLAENINISAREVAKRHPEVASASTITRDRARRELLEIYQLRQVELNKWQDRLKKGSKAEVATKLEQQQSRIEQLERNEEILLRGHVSLIAVMAELGGTTKLSSYYNRFSELRDSLAQLNALPESARKISGIAAKERKKSPPKKRAGK
ncbi:hypothetical protein F2P45_18830 [Massilia sp. CCM 8733]|uniref:Uncharacterized protein n=1 Tax=Massilia mucilaginosa TaxID=2609282 RepID=A0ABX0NWE9_9BURK|nr:hypothetical protein [Massilia mucilaginosa]NHZ91055.1 hypothetical protein [Massilia mucilaginosa]